MPVWLNDGLVAAEAARIAPDDRGFTLGDGLFETVRVAAGQPRHLERHLARLRDGAAVLELPVPAGIAAACAALIAAAGLADGALRVTLSRGPAPRGVLPPPAPSPTLLITAGPLPPSTPLRAVIARTTRRNEHSPLSRLKTLNYLDAVLARQEAARRGADEALMLNTAGRLAEATAANLVLRIGDRVFTPPVAEGALPGIHRGLILEHGMAEERPLTLEDLAVADEIVLCNSLGVRAVIAVGGAEVGGAEVGGGAPGPLAARLSGRHAASA